MLCCVVVGLGTAAVATVVVAVVAMTMMPVVVVVVVGNGEIVGWRLMYSSVGGESTASEQLEVMRIGAGEAHSGEITSLVCITRAQSPVRRAFLVSASMDRLVCIWCIGYAPLLPHHQHQHHRSTANDNANNNSKNSSRTQHTSGPTSIHQPRYHTHAAAPTPSCAYC